MIDYETLMNDKRLLRQEVDEWKNKYLELKKAYTSIKTELDEVYDQRSDLTNEVMRLSAIVERMNPCYVDDGK